MVALYLFNTVRKHKSSPAIHSPVKFKIMKQHSGDPLKVHTEEQ